ncbi:DUF1799 domain-containing protein [Pseudoxanthomonas sp.]|uniref:DUF1799 domain-containing protein n=1 Tax=Pseudoxanthomonas sp. TaxID=1871049 RepID=UPI0025D41737|nr:DUF1799 domain-containing protein [Pseudoxanthomonas sp.]
MPDPGTSTADFLRPRDGSDEDQAEDQVIEVEVLEDNWSTVEVFGRCQPNWIVGLGGASYAGITATEIEAACRLLQIPTAQWPDISQGVRVMALASAEEYRQKR